MKTSFVRHSIAARNLLALALSVALAACGQKGGDGDPLARALLTPPTGPLLASVNGETISEPLLATYARGRKLDLTDPAQRTVALESLIETTLLAQAALADGAAASDEARGDIALLRAQYLGTRALNSFRAKVDVSDAKVLEYYQEQALRAGTTEWRLEHILVADEGLAKTIAARATGGEDFAALMVEYGGTARQAKSLDWANPTRLPPELAEVAAELPDGMVAPAPIQTSFGWHVLRRAESRPFVPPDFESVKEAARQQLLERAVKDYVAGLRAKATVAVGAGGPAAGG